MGYWLHSTFLTTIGCGDGRDAEVPYLALIEHIKKITTRQGRRKRSAETRRIGLREPIREGRPQKALNEPCSIVERYNEKKKSKQLPVSVQQMSAPYR